MTDLDISFGSENYVVIIEYDMPLNSFLRSFISDNKTNQRDVSQGCGYIQFTFLT